MKFFTKLFLAVALLIPAVAGAENIAPITYNPSRSGWYYNLKVVSNISFMPSVNITTLNIGAPSKVNTLQVEASISEGEEIGGTITTLAIQPKATGISKQTTVRFPTAKLTSPSNLLPVVLNGGELKGGNGTVFLSEATQLPIFASKAYLKKNSNLTVEKITEGVKTFVNKNNDSIKLAGWKLGPHTIPVPNAASGCLKWKDAKIGSETTTRKVLVLTTTNCN